MYVRLLSLVILAISLGVLLFTSFADRPSSKVLSEVDTTTNRDVFLGAWVGGFWDSPTKILDVDALKKFERNIGKKVAIATIFSGWEYLSEPELIENLDIISSNSWIPLISSNPSFNEACPDTGKNLYKAIADGDCDALLTAISRNLANYNEPVMLRFAWEMNQPTMYWSIDKLESTPEDFKEAWRHFHEVSRKEGADNIIWVLSFNTSNSVSTPYKDLYPGDEYVDWVAIDGYNWGDSHFWSTWSSFHGVYKRSYSELIAITDKPIMLSEVNSAPTGGDKAKWLSDMLNEQIPNRYQRIGAVVFFNENKSEGESVDWRLERDPNYLRVVSEALRDNKIYKSSFF